MAVLTEKDKEWTSSRKQYERGIITDQERYNKSIDEWTERPRADHQEADGRAEVRPPDRITGKMVAYLNPIHLMAHSGARGGVEQIRQLAGMRGLMAKPSGQIIETPIKANFREGLSVLEYFSSSTHGARKGWPTPPSRRPTAGYLTRKLADVAQNVVITMHDCGTTQGVTKGVIYKGDEIDRPLFDAIRGRVGRNPIYNPVTGDAIVEENEMITAGKARAHRSGSGWTRSPSGRP